MKKTIVFSFLVLSFTFCSSKKDSFVNSNMNFIADQYNLLLSQGNDSTKIPRTINPDGSLKKVGEFDWTSGFFAGNLWNIYNYTKDEKWLYEAEKWTDALEDVQYYTNNHDVGFMLYCSYGNGLKLTNNEEYRSVLLNGAESLISRYNPNVGSIKSWNSKQDWDGVTLWKFPVIIDNMMNLELLFWASKSSGDPKYKEIAIQHARTTMKNHYRSDYSCYHVVNYDSATGIVMNKGTAQGFSDNSSWARGQAWGLYGFTMCYRETGLNEFLDMATNIADFMISNPNLPEDGITYWDYNVNQEGYSAPWEYDPKNFKYIPRDASAAAITASALYELSTLVKDGEIYLEAANKIVNSLASPEYSAEPGENYGFVLKHSVGSIPHGAEIDVPIIYADYYYTEALLRKDLLEKGKPLSK